MCACQDLWPPVPVSSMARLPTHKSSLAAEAGGAFPQCNVQVRNRGHVHCFYMQSSDCKRFSDEPFKTIFEASNLTDLHRYTGGAS